MTDICERLVRPNIKAMKPYASARGTAQTMEGFAFLDAAENPYCPFSDEDAGSPYYNPLNRYPEPQPAALLEKFAGLYGVNKENIVVTRGSEEAIRLLMQVFCTPQKDALLTCPPTFAMYPIEAQIHDAENIKIPRIGEFCDRLDVNAILEQGRQPHVKIVFICNPGNPSSTPVPDADIEAVIEGLAEHCMVVIDEAYIEFAEHASYVAKLSRYPNLIVLRTLSKSYGLAGLRCGTVVAHPPVVNYLRRILSAYPVPRPVQMLAEEALTPSRLEAMQDKQILLKSERDRMLAALRNYPSIRRVFPSRTNFLCLEVADAPACVQTFARHKIVIRDRSAGIPNCVNIAVGTPEQNDKVLEIFRSLND